MQDVKTLIDKLMCNKSKKELSCANRFKEYTKLLEIAKKKPEIVYPYWAHIEEKLFSQDNAHKFHGIDIIPQLARADKNNKINKIINKYISLTKDPSFVIAMHATAGLGLIAKEKPELANKITKALLNIDYNKTKHPDLLRSAAVDSFIKYKPKNKQVTTFIKKLLNSDSPKAIKKAKEFFIINSDKIN